jgi:hypothetical protein
MLIAWRDACQSSVHAIWRAADRIEIDHGAIRRLGETMAQGQRLIVIRVKVTRSHMLLAGKPSRTVADFWVTPGCAPNAALDSARRPYRRPAEVRRRRSLYVALIVGTVLNPINQGDALLGMASIDWLKLILTYCVPYAVCTYFPTS